MSLHSNSRVWVHLIWSTNGHLEVLTPGSAARVSCFLEAKAEELGIFMFCNYVNADHVHILIDLPVDWTIADIVQKLKGASARWINQRGLTLEHFGWNRGYGAFSVSPQDRDIVARYIARQSEHHRREGYSEELRRLLKENDAWRRG